MGFLLIIGLIFILVIGVIIFLSFWIPKKLGYPKAGKIIGILVSCFFAYQIITMIFEDELFSKNDAIELLKEQDVLLKDEFEIEENKSIWAIGDYYHTFTLIISENDKNRIIKEIQNSTKFQNASKQIIELRYNDMDLQVGKRIIQNYETEHSFVREYYQENDAGYAPTYRKICVNKNENKLTFEDIDE